MRRLVAAGAHDTEPREPALLKRRQLEAGRGSLAGEPTEMPEVRVTETKPEHEIVELAV